MRILNRIGGLIISPKQTAKILVHEKPGIGEPLAVVVLFSMARWTSLTLALRHLINYVLAYPMMPASQWVGELVTIALGWATPYIVVFGLLADLMFWLLLSIGVYLFLRGLEGRAVGSFEDGLSMLGYTWVRTGFTVAPLTFTPFLPLTSLSLTLVTGLIGVLWTIYAAGLLLSEAHGVTVGKAVLSLIATFLALFLTIGLLAILFTRGIGVVGWSVESLP